MVSVEVARVAVVVEVDGHQGLLVIAQYTRGIGFCRAQHDGVDLLDRGVSRSGERQID